MFISPISIKNWLYSYFDIIFENIKDLIFYFFVKSDIDYRLEVTVKPKIEKINSYMEEFNSHVDLTNFIPTERSFLRKSNPEHRRASFMNHSQRKSMKLSEYTSTPNFEISSTTLSPTGNANNLNSSDNSEKLSSSNESTSSSGEDLYIVKDSIRSSADLYVNESPRRQSTSMINVDVLPPSIVNFEMTDKYICDNCDMDDDSKEICKIVRNPRRKTLSPEMFLEDIEKLRNSSPNNQYIETEC